MLRQFLAVNLLVWLFTFTSQAEAQSISNFDNRAKGGYAGQTIAFVGKKIELQEIENYCPEDYICMDARFNARYEIRDLLAGEYEGKTIDFVVYDHSGTPRFSQYDNIVIYIYQAEDGYIHHKYSYDLLSPVKNGTYAYCGDPYSDYKAKDVAEKGRQDLDNFEFSPSIRVKLSDQFPNEEDMEHMDQDDIREHFLDVMRKYSPPAYKIRGNTATCKMGMSAQDLVDVRMKYEYTPKK